MVQIKNWDFDNPDYTRPEFNKKNDPKRTKYYQISAWMKVYNQFKKTNPQLLADLISDITISKEKNDIIAKRYGINKNTFRKVKIGYELVGIPTSIIKPLLPTIPIPKKIKKYPHKWVIPFLFNRCSGFDDKYKLNMYILQFLSAFSYDRPDSHKQYYLKFVDKGIKFIENDLNYNRPLAFNIGIVTQDYTTYYTSNYLYVKGVKQDFWNEFDKAFRYLMMKVEQSPPVFYVGWELKISVK